MKELINKLKTALATLTLTPEQRKPIEDQLALLEAEASKAPATPAPTPTATSAATTVALPPEVMQALSEVKSLKDLIADERTKRETAEKAMADKVKADAKKSLDDYVKKVTEEEKKVSPADMKEKWLPLLEKDFEGAKKIIDGMAPNPSAKKAEGEKKNTDATKREGIMRAAPQGILNKVLEFAQVSEN